MSKCSHAIFAYGTFGFWGAFLTGGIIVTAANVSSVRPTNLEEMLLKSNMENLIMIPAHL